MSRSIKLCSFIFKSLVLLGSADISFCQSLPQSAFAGIVLDAENRQPIQGARLIVSGEERESHQMEPLGSSSGLDGKFVIAGTPAVKYIIRCEKPGFETLSYSVIPSEQKVTPGMASIIGNTGIVEFLMIAHAAVTGRILDHDRQPLVGATVRLTSLHQLGSRTVLSVVMQTSTNDLGEYRIFGVKPGRYYINAYYLDASAALGLITKPLQDGSSKTVTESYSAVYYPDSPDLENAIPIKLQSRRTTSGVDMAVRMAESFQVSGEITGLPTERSVVNIFLRPSSPASLGPVLLESLGPGQSHFRFRSVPSGEYVLSSTFGQLAQGLVAREKVTISSSLSGVLLQFKSPFSAKGTISMDDGSKIPNKVKFKLRGIETGLDTDLKVDEEGHFEVANIGSDQFGITAFDEAGTMFVKSLLLDANPSPTGLVAIRGPNHILHAVVSAKAGRIDGLAVSAIKQPESRGLAVLVSTDSKNAHTYSLSLGLGGDFAFRAIPPGNYRISCFSDLSSPQDATWDVQRKVKMQGKSIEVKDSDQQKLTIETTMFDPM